MIRDLIKTGSIAAIILLSNYVNAQSPYVQGVKPPTFPSPNAASLGKFGDIPVSYHTGTPEISIPIYTLKQGNLSLPVSVSYHSSGVRVSDVASWVGLGWALNTGGMITRSIHGGPDDGAWGPYAHPISSLGIRGWYNSGGIPAQLLGCQNVGTFAGSLQQSQANGPGGTVVTAGIGQSCYEYYSDAANGYIDTEPDLYTFSFGGHSGKFFFDPNGQPHTFPEDDLRIQPVFKSGTQLFDGFDITTADGVKYVFGRAAGTEITKNDPIGMFTGPLDNLTSTTWYLIQVVSPNGEDMISLTYVDEAYSYGNRGGQSLVLNNLGGIVGSANPNIASGLLSVSMIAGKRLSQITTNSGLVTITFTGTNLRQDVTNGTTGVQNANTQATSLDQIQIQSAGACKRFSFNYDYFIAGIDCNGNCDATLFDKKRLRLNSIQESDCNGNTLPPHAFTYNSRPLPRRYSLARDQWEYYNGADNGVIDSNTGLIANTVLNPITGAVLGTANRTVNETAMQAGILTKITYPTGGSTSFYYEAHRETTGGPLIGGLRVKQIDNDDGNGSIISKSIQYGPGILYGGTPIFVQYPNNSGQGVPTMQFGTIVAATPNSAMWSTQGYHIGYSNVTEFQTGNGKTVYNFMNSGPLGIPSPSNYPLRELVAGFGTSEQTEKDVFLEGAGTPVHLEQSGKSIGNYPVAFSVRKVVGTPCISVSPNDQCAQSQSSGGGIFYAGGVNNLYTDYNIYSNRFQLNGTTTTSDGVTTNTYYEYGLNLGSPTATTVTDSKGIIERIEWDYPITPGAAAPPEMYDKNNANFKFMIGVPVVQRKLRNSVLTNKVVNTYTTTSGKVLLTQNTEYKTGGTDHIDGNYAYDATSLRLNSITTTGNNQKSLIWGYGNSVPIAEVVNAAPNKIFHTSFEDFNPAQLSTDAKTGKYSYSSLAFTVQLPSPGTYTLCYWIKPLNGTWQWVQTTVSATPTIGGNGALLDEVRLYPAGSMMTTYTYEPAMGITSSTDPNGQTTTYEYDSFWRLKNTRDAKGNIVQNYIYNYKQ